MDYKTLYSKYMEVLKENKKLKKEIAALKNINEYGTIEVDYNPAIISNDHESIIDVNPSDEINQVNDQSTPEEKIALFKEMFVGRKDVYAKRWSSKKGTSGYSPVCLNEWVSGVCNKPISRCSSCNNNNYDEFNEKAIDRHLRGFEIYGIYPLLINEMCRFVAIDFDKHEWKEDIRTIRKVCDEFNIPVAIERSRSGNGAHAWIFFQEVISASLARKLGTAIITYCMSKRHEIKFKSYDRLFPNQDTMPKGGFGNLIAVPLQKEARKYGNSEFVDEKFQSYNDQWAHLNSIRKMNEEEVEKAILNLCNGNEYGDLKSEELEEKPWLRNKKSEYKLSQKDFPSEGRIVLANMIYIKKQAFSNAALNSIKRLAAFKNPEFFKAQAMRLPTFNKPRIIDLSEENHNYLCIPRGCKEDLDSLLTSFQVKIEYDDERYNQRDIDVIFNGELRDRQKDAVSTLLNYDSGVLSATTAFGKTVIGAYLISSRKKNTLILVHTRQLLEQWQERLKQFLIINETFPQQEKKRRGRKKIRNIIGQIGAGKNRPSGIIDIALMQSLVKGDEVKDFIKEYGMVIIDECHHIPAFSFEQIMRSVYAKYVYGLTATPIRKDGHHPIIFMQCGPIRYKVNAKEEAVNRSFEHYITPRFTSFRRLPNSDEDDNYNITSIYAELVENDLRNNIIAQDVINAVNNGRNSIVLTERTKHVDILFETLNDKLDYVIKLTGKMSVKKRREELKRLSMIPTKSNFVIIATGRFVGEGFDEPRLDTLFLAMPVAWKGTVAQYAGRLHREAIGKSEVTVYDYVDVHIPVLEKMYQKRLKAYAAIGYKTRGEKTEDTVNAIHDEKTFFPVFKQDVCSATSDVLIVSPFISKSRLITMLKLITDEINTGTNFVVVTRPKSDFKEKDQTSFTKNINLLINNGVKVIFKTNIHQKFAIIDQKIVWYGSINLLSYGRATESIMRLSSLNIANELLASIHHIKNTDYIAE